MKQFRLIVILIFTLFTLTSCKTTLQTEGKMGASTENSLTLIFAGDIMAHTPNYSMKDFSLIWNDIKPDLQTNNIAFANIEAPVNDSLPFESYPTFNMKSAYPNAALDAGFNLLSLANNHTNDKNSLGIKATQNWAFNTEAQTKEAARPIHFSGLQENNNFSYRIFSCGKWKILFVAVTELLNTWKNYSEINYVKPNKKGRASFIEYTKTLREQNPCDIFILSVHTSEAEYVLTVENQVKEFYHALLDAGVDIVVSNHPHVVRPVEYIGEKSQGKIRKVIMYGNGNTISSQRRKIDFENPKEIWQYTGDGQMVTLEIKKDKDAPFTPYIEKKQIQYITTYVDENKNYIVKKLNDDFFEELKSNKKEKLANYFKSRKTLLEEIKEIYTWQ